jgi:hypothetical protein
LIKRIKTRMSQWDRYDNDRALFAVIGSLIGLGSVFAGAPVVLGIGVGLLTFTVLTGWRP